MPFTYKKEDFDTSEPYADLMQVNDPFERQIQEDELKEYAIKLGVPSFSKRLKMYKDSLNPRKNAKLHEVRMTNFTSQPIDLDSGDWVANDFGITKDTDKDGTIFACPNPITITRRIVNIDTGEEKLELAYTKGDKKWRRRIFSKDVTSNSRKIVELAKCGIAVTSETAKYLVNYLFQLENLNLDIIPEIQSISRLGMIQDVGFSPYVDGIVFDGDDNLKNAYSAIKSKGSRDDWVKLMQGLRGTNVELRILLAASFASVLISPLNINPFFVHIWSGESGSGKTVALMCAASVWGDPHWQGQAYIQTFNATQVGLERSAAFFNHLPYMIDELQLLKDSHGRNKFDIVYLLSEGRGRTRGNKLGGIDQTPTWANCIITTGETPITTDSSGAGAINRVISIECSPERPIITDGNKLVSLLYQNYGFAGKEFVDKLYEPGDLNITLAQDTYDEFFKELSEGESTEKQAMAAAAVLTGDTLATKWIFQDGQALTAKDISKFLATKDEVNVGERGYHFICDWVAQNANKMREQTSDDRGEIYGIIEDNVAYIIASVFDNACRNGGFDPRPLRSWMRKKGLLMLQGDTNRSTVTKKIGEMNSVRCVAVILQSDDKVSSDEDLPF
jgi:uncharacterized protein (DUF927 family)